MEQNYVTVTLYTEHKGRVACSGEMRPRATDVARSVVCLRVSEYIHRVAVT